MGEDITKRFDSISIDEDTQDVILESREMFKALALFIDRADNGREKSLALTHLEEASHWATRAFALTESD